MRIEGNIVVTSMTTHTFDENGVLIPSSHVHTTLVMKDGAPYKALVKDEGRTVGVVTYSDTERYGIPETTTYDVADLDPAMQAVLTEFKGLRFACGNEIFWDPTTPFSNRLRRKEIWVYASERCITLLHEVTPLVTMSREMDYLLAYWDRSFHDTLVRANAFTSLITPV